MTQALKRSTTGSDFEALTERVSAIERQLLVEFQGAFDTAQGETASGFSSLQQLLLSSFGTNVKKFGARGNGVLGEDDDAIKQAILASGGGALIFPKGTYRLGATQTLLNDMVVMGEGSKSTIILPPGADAFTGNGLTGITFRDLKFLGNGGSTDTGNGINLLGCSRLLVTACDFQDMATGIGTGGAGVVFNNCSRARFINNSGFNAGYALANFFNSRTFAAVGNVHTNTRGTAPTLLSTCVYANSGSTDGAFIGNVSDGDTYPIEVRIGCKRIIVKGNIVKSCSQIGVVVQTIPAAAACTDIIVIGNDLDMSSGSTYGIFIDSVAYCAAADNDIGGGCNIAAIAVSRIGAAADGTDNDVLNNRIRSTDEMGITVAAGCARTRVNGNRVTSTADNRSIYVQGDDCDVEHNYVYDSGWHGIDVQGTGGHVFGNRVNATRNSGVGIQLAAGNMHGNNRAHSTSGAPYNYVMPTVAAAGTVTLPINSGTVQMSGTGNVTGITAMHAEYVVRLISSGSWTLVDGGNLKLNGNFVSTGDDVIALTCDGTNYYEISRSVN